jgi:hypothetical protein
MRIIDVRSVGFGCILLVTLSASALAQPAQPPPAAGTPAPTPDAGAPAPAPDAGNAGIQPGQVELESIPAGRAILPILGDSGPIGLRLHLRSSASQQATISGPMLVDFALHGAGNARYQPDIDGVAFRAMDGASPPACTASQEDAGTREDAGAQDSANLTLPPRAGKTLCLELSGVRHTGQYSGSVRIALDDGQALSQPVELYVKQSWWVLAFWLGLGVGASAGLRYWFAKNRPDLIRREHLLRMREQVEALAADASENEVLEIKDALRRSIDDALGKLRAEWTEVDAEWESKMSAWLKTLPACIALYEEWLLIRRPGAPPAPSQAIDDATRLLRRAAIIASVLTLEEIEAAHKALIAARPVESGQQRMERLEQQLQALEQMPGADSAGQRGPVYEAAHKRLTSARDALRDPARQAEAQRMVEEADQAWTRVRVAELQAALQQDAIHDGRAGEWKQLRERADTLGRAMDDKLAPPDAQAQLRALMRAFLVEVVTQVGQRVDVWSQASETAPAARKAEIRSAIEKVKDRRSALQVELDRGDLDRAEAAYKELATVYETLRQSTTTMGTQEVGLRVMATVPAGPEIREQPHRPGEPLERETSADVRRERSWKTFAVLGLGFGIALIVGTRTLWLDNLTWGGAGSWIEAILWGLGIHQIAGVGFDGIEGQLKKVVK